MKKSTINDLLCLADSQNLRTRAKAILLPQLTYRSNDVLAEHRPLRPLSSLPGTPPPVNVVSRRSLTLSLQILVKSVQRENRQHSFLPQPMTTLACRSPTMLMTLARQHSHSFVVKGGAGRTQKSEFRLAYRTRMGSVCDHPGCGR